MGSGVSCAANSKGTAVSAPLQREHEAADAVEHNKSMEPDKIGGEGGRVHYLFVKHLAVDLPGKLSTVNITGALLVSVTIRCPAGGKAGLSWRVVPREEVAGVHSEPGSAMPKGCKTIRAGESKTVGFDLGEHEGSVTLLLEGEGAVEVKCNTAPFFSLTLRPEAR